MTVDRFRMLQIYFYCYILFMAVPNWSFHCLPKRFLWNSKYFNILLLWINLRITCRCKRLVCFQNKDRLLVCRYFSSVIYRSDKGLILCVFLWDNPLLCFNLKTKYEGMRMAEKLSNKRMCFGDSEQWNGNVSICIPSRSFWPVPEIYVHAM